MKFSTKQNDPQALLAETKKAADHLFTVRGTISRVMSRTAIYPGCLLPGSSSDLPETDGPPYVSFAVLLRMGFTYAPPVTGRAVVSCTALPPLPCRLRAPKRLRTDMAVHFCCTVPGVTSAGRYPASCPVKPGLSSPGPFVCPAAAVCPAYEFRTLSYGTDHELSTYRSKHPPPINSLTSEFFGMSSAGIGRK